MFVLLSNHIICSLIKKLKSNYWFLCGPFSKFQLDTESKNFIEIVESTILAYKPQKVIFRFHPRQSENLKRKFLKCFNKHYSNFYSQNNEESLLDTVTDSFCVIGGSSQALRVARLSNNRIIVIGVLNAFYVSSIMG